jgi:hypothetical protein
MRFIGAPDPACAGDECVSRDFQYNLGVPGNESFLLHKGAPVLRTGIYCLDVLGGSFSAPPLTLRGNSPILACVVALGICDSRMVRQRA